MMRYELSTAQWHRVESFLPRRPGWVGATAKDNRAFVNGVLWALPNGAQWKDLPRSTAAGARPRRCSLQPGGGIP